MKSQYWLVLVFVAFMATLTKSIPSDVNLLHDDDNKIKNELPRGLDPRYNKMLPYPPELEKVKPSMPVPLSSSTSTPVSKTTIAGPSIAKTPVKMEGRKNKLPLADDPRYNKMLPQSNMLKDSSTESSKEDDDDYYDYDYEYDDDVTTSTDNKTIVTTEKSNSHEDKLKPIKGDDKSEPPKKETNNNDNNVDDEDEIDDIEDEEEIIFNENVPCPRDCICQRNVNSYLVATCSRLDADVQKFGSDITDLVVVDVGPKYPLLLGPEFFVKIGLKHISSIKIANCTIEYIHPTAFQGLDDLYSVNLTNVGLTLINPDTFAQNKRLRLLTIAGNDLSEISRRGSPNARYLLKSSSVEELDLSNNNLKELQPTAFNELSNIVYINLAQNGLKDLPENIFSKMNTIEELDLSYNSISTLPQNIFNRTALAMLHLKYNEITSDLKFGTSDLQQLDLSFCSIKHITNHMFNKMEGLTNLNLKGNGLTKIQPDSFSSLRNLRHIDLSINDLDQVSSLLFFKNAELDVIRLNDNPRLTILPTDGFQSDTGVFNVYLLDISNCAIGALGHKTFSTMPHLTTLKLAWNNINNLEKGTFKYSDKLTELDLSNNLIVRLDDLLFLHNREMAKLNLAGNPIKKLSAKLFLPLNNLKELDVSECELHALLSDNYYGVDSRFKFYESLRYFNASFNQIRRVSKEDLRYFKNLRTLDISNNPLKCNEEFKELMKYLGRKNIVSGKIPTNLNLDDSFAIATQTAQTWDDLARGVCKRTGDALKPSSSTEIPSSTTEKMNTVEDISEDLNKKILNEAKEDIEEDTSLGEDDGDGDDDQVDDDDYGYDDDEDQEEDVDLNENQPTVKDKGLFADEVNNVKEIKTKFLKDKLTNEDEDDDDDDDDDEEVIIEREKIYYTSYRFLWPIFVIIFGVILLLLVIAKVVSMLMRKRGERYRQAILASKNSFVYQKLSEEITPRTPKVHRYARINQV